MGILLVPIIESCQMTGTVYWDPISIWSFNDLEFSLVERTKDYLRDVKLLFLLCCTISFILIDLAPV